MCLLYVCAAHSTYVCIYVHLTCIQQPATTESARHDLDGYASDRRKAFLSSRPVAALHLTHYNLALASSGLKLADFSPPGRDSIAVGFGPAARAPRWRFGQKFSSLHTRRHIVHCSMSRSLDGRRTRSACRIPTKLSANQVNLCAGSAHLSARRRHHVGQAEVEIHLRAQRAVRVYTRSTRV